MAYKFKGWQQPYKSSRTNTNYWKVDIQKPKKKKKIKKRLSIEEDKILEDMWGIK